MNELFQMVIIWTCIYFDDLLLYSGQAADRYGWAFGLGLERLAMVLFAIPDIRLFWTEDDRFTSQFKEGKIVKFNSYSKHPMCYKDVSFWLPETGLHPNDVYEVLPARTHAHTHNPNPLLPHNTTHFFSSYCVAQYITPHKTLLNLLFRNCCCYTSHLLCSSTQDSLFWT